MAGVLNLSHELSFDSSTVMSRFVFLLQDKFAYCHTFFLIIKNKSFICPTRCCIIVCSEVLVDSVIQTMHFSTIKGVK